MTKIYIAGPMSGRPYFAFPVFDGVAADLRARGYDVVSPAELDDPAFRARVMEEGKTGTEKHLLGAWGDCLARDVKLISDGGIEGIVLLHDWHKSRGARLEAFVGVLCKLKFGLYDPRQIGGVLPVTQFDVVNVIFRSKFE
jgi:hypothetical protein